MVIYVWSSRMGLGVEAITLISISSGSINVLPLDKYLVRKKRSHKQFFFFNVLSNELLYFKYNKVNVLVTVLGEWWKNK